MKYRLFLITFILASMLSGQELKYMFGSTKTSPSGRKFADFTFLSDQDKSIAKTSQKEGWHYIGSGFVGKNSGSLPADPLLEHGIFFRDGKMEFSLPDGKYFLRIYLGDWFMGQQRIPVSHDARVALAVNGKFLFDKKLTPKDIRRNWLKLEEYLFSASDSAWDRLVKPVLEEKVYETTVTNGKLTLYFHNIALTALTVFPDQKASLSHARKVEELRRKEFARRYPWKPAAEEPMPKVSERDLQRGFLLFQKYGEDIVSPWTRPREWEVSDCIKVFAARGEQEMLRFGIIPLRELKNFYVKVGDFKGKNGVLPLQGNSDFYQERYKEFGSQSATGRLDEMWRLDPRSAVMIKPRKIDCEKGTPRMYTLDVRIPLSQKAGIYYAPVTFFEGDKQIGSARLLLKVLPFALEEKGAALYSFQQPDMDLFGDYVEGYKDNQKIYDTIVSYIRFQARYGFSAIHFTGWCGVLHSFYRLGRFQGKAGERHFVQTPEEKKRADVWFRMLKNEGKADFIAIQLFPLFLLHCNWHPGRGVVKGGQYFGTKNDSPEELRLKRKDIIQLMKDVEALFREKKGIWPELYWYVSGEADNFGLEGVRQALKAAQLVKEAGGKSFTVIDGPLGAKLFPPVYDCILANHQAPLGDELVKEVKKYGHKIGAHNTGDARFIAGWHFWRTGSFHKYQETGLYTNYVRPFAYLPWNYQSAMLLPAPEGGFTPTIYWLNYRDGREDYLYLYTLEQKIRKARKEGKNLKAVEEAEQFLAEMHSRIRADIRYYHLSRIEAWEGSGSIRNDEWNTTSFERYRWNIALLIEALDK